MIGMSGLLTGGFLITEYEGQLSGRYAEDYDLLFTTVNLTKSERQYKVINLIEVNAHGEVIKTIPLNPPSDPHWI
jgi:hypothetical protein